MSLKRQNHESVSYSNVDHDFEYLTEEQFTRNTDTLIVNRGKEAEKWQNLRNIVNAKFDELKREFQR